MQFEKIPHVTLTAEQKSECLQILGECNTLLRKWAAYFPPRKFRWFCRAVFSGDKNPDSQIPEDKLEEFHRDLPSILVVRQCHAFLNNRTIEDAIVQNFANMTLHHANKWAVQSTTLEVEDYLQEAYLRLYDAVYSWLPNSADICTYVYAAIRNRFANVCNHQDNMFCAISQQDMNLVIAYKKHISSAKNRIVFDEVVQEMNLSDEQACRLSFALKKIQIEGNISEEVEYTYSHVKFEVNQHESEDFVDSTLRKANLSDLEKELILLAMEDEPGWQSEYARTHNSQRGVPYSRVRIGQILQLAREKVAAVLKVA